MAHDIILLMAQYGLLLVFLNVLVEQVGVPVPAVPTLMVAGALAANGKLPLVGVVAVALCACLLGDLLWYWAGRRFGGGVMRTICRISLSPDSCVKQSELRFQRWRGQVLLVAKFVPGLSTVAPPLVGAMGLRLPAFLWLDGLGSLLWVALAVALGQVFASQMPCSWPWPMRAPWRSKWCWGCWRCISRSSGGSAGGCCARCGWRASPSTS